MNRIKTTQLSWNPETRTFVGEASEIRFGGREMVVVESERTGKTKQFQFVRAITDPEGEVTGWQYKSTDTQYNLLVIND